MAKEKKTRYELETLFNALHNRGNRPKDLEDLAENQIVEKIIVQLRSLKLDKGVRRISEHRLYEIVLSDRLNPHGRRRALKYLLRRHRQHKLKGSLAKKIKLFCKENNNADWVKVALKNKNT